MRITFIFLATGLFLCVACSNKHISNEGELIYRTGRNKQGERLLDIQRSQITIFKSCQGCHGKNGERIKDCTIKWSSLSDPDVHPVPYTDSLFFRFLDEDIKSNGTPARTGVHWKMRTADKVRLLEYLKTL